MPCARVVRDVAPSMVGLAHANGFDPCMNLDASILPLKKESACRYLIQDCITGELSPHGFREVFFYLD
jgi:hypothetical protein